MIGTFAAELVREDTVDRSRVREWTDQKRGVEVRSR